MQDLAKAKSDIEKEIGDAALNAGRNEKEIQLVAVSKGQSKEKILAAYNLGLRNFGESYAQEFFAKKKWAEENNLKEIIWHFIGGIQSNKIKQIVGADYIHSVSSLRHAKILNDSAHETKKIFLQINLNEDQKRQGIFVQNIFDLSKEILLLNKLQLVGLMCILPQDNRQKNSFWFLKMQKLKSELEKKLSLNNLKLSMGMSQDFCEAIHYGSNFVRVGTKLFGARAEAQ